MMLWAASSPASGLQVIDRLIRSSPSLWPRVMGGSTEGMTASCRDVAEAAGCAMAAPCPVELVEDRVSLMRTWRRQLARLLEEPGIAQRTDAWYAARAQLTTASDVAAAIGGRNGATKEFLVKKAGTAEEQRPFSGSAPPLKWGVMFEPVASAIYSRRMGVHVHEFGLLRHPRIQHIGASPDGISDMGVMLEIKCPFSRVIDGTVPSAYVAQIQCQLDVCGLDECDFFECMFEEVEESTAKEGDACTPAWDGCEQGVLVEHWSDPSQAYVYHYCPDIGGNRWDEVRVREAWVSATVEMLRLQGHATVIPRRWRLRGHDIVRVQRDHAYVESMNLSVAIAWRRVVRYREDRQAYREEVLQGANRRGPQVHVAQAQMKGYAFVDEDEDEDKDKDKVKDKPIAGTLPRAD